MMQNLKESLDECDLGTQYHLARYSYLFERTLVNDGLTVSPLSADDGTSVSIGLDAIELTDRRRPCTEGCGRKYRSSRRFQDVHVAIRPRLADVWSTRSATRWSL